MSVKNGVWHDAMMDPPGAEHVNNTVLVVREIGEGKRAYRKIDFAIYNSFVMKAPSCTWAGKWNKRGVIFWMPMPDLPGEEKNDCKDCELTEIEKMKGGCQLCRQR